MALIPAYYLDAVVSIGQLDKDGYKSLATSFLVGLLTGQKTLEGHNTYSVYLATNRHVFAEKKEIHLRFNLSAGGTKTYCLPLLDEKNQPKWIAHPNGTIDLAALQVNYGNMVQAEKIKCNFIQEENMAFLDVIKREGITQGDSIFALGFPLQMAGIEQNYVIARGGIIARLDDEIVKKESSFLIDSNIFPGNSGGPVILKPEVTAIEGTPAVNKAYLLGVISGYIAYQDVAVSLQTKQPRVIFNENSGLAKVVPMDFIKEMLQKKTEDKPDTPKEVEVKTNESASAQPAAQC